VTEIATAIAGILGIEIKRSDKLVLGRIQVVVLELLCAG